MKTALLAACLIALQGCTYLSAEMQHVSHPLAGPPFGPKTEEDSLNTVNACAGRERQGWYVEQCLGYKLTDGGVYGPKLTYEARFGKRIQLR